MGERAVRLFLSRYLAIAALSVLLFGGCFPAPDQGGDLQPPGDSLQSAAVPPEGAGSPGEDTPPPMGPEQPPPETQGIPPILTGADSIALRLDRLEAENDSLRAAVGTLLSFLGGRTGAHLVPTPDSVVRRARTDSLGIAGELLGVDAGRVQNWGIRIIVAIFFFAFTGLVIRLVIWVLDKLAERNAKRRLFFKRLVPVARISLWFMAILFISMVILRIEAQGLIAAGAAIGVAVGFAAQDILKNIFGGLIVLFDQPFQVGDKISVEGTYGEVVSIGLRSTRIVTPDDNLVSVPNAQVVDGQVANANAGELNCQVVTDLYLPGWVDEARAKRIAFEAATSSKYVFLNKPIVVLVKDEFREIFLTHLKVKAYVLDPRYEFLFMSDVTERARAGFRKAGLLGPMHGVRAYVDLDRFPEIAEAAGRGEGETG